MGSAVLGWRVLRAQGLGGLQADATPAVMQQVIFLFIQCLPRLPASASLCPAGRRSYGSVLDKS